MFQGAGKGSKRKVDARYAGEGYGLLTQAGCVRMRSRGDSPIGLRVMDWIALRAMSIKSALRECLPALIVILTLGEESRSKSLMRQMLLNISQREGCRLAVRTA